MTIDVAQLKADFRRALEAHDRKDYATALQIVRPVAEQGHVGARYLLALPYEHGRGLPADPAEAQRALVHVKLPNSARKKETLDMTKEPGGWKILDF